MEMVEGVLQALLASWMAMITDGMCEEDQRLIFARLQLGKPMLLRHGLARGRDGYHYLCLPHVMDNVHEILCHQ